MTAGTHVGEFEILSPLGAGGMGEVYRAHDPRLEREVALKVLPAETLTDERARARLLREARMASKLNHPNICTIYEVGEADGQAFIAMELVSGEALSERLSVERMVVDEVLRLGHQMADALAHAHSNGVVHRDFKSGNVVITPEGNPKRPRISFPSNLYFALLSLTEPSRCLPELPGPPLVGPRPP